MNRAKPATTRATLCLFLFAVLFAGISNAYDYGPDFPPCEQDKCSVDIHSDAASCWMHGANQIIHYMSPMEGGLHSIPNACRRSNIFGGGGYLVTYPSTGGVVFLRNPSAVDLQHLGLPHTNDTARVPAEDDVLAARMVQMGAQWWPDWGLYFRHSTRIDNGLSYEDHFPSNVHVAFPSTGGAWVANFTRDKEKYYEDEDDRICAPWLPHPPDLWRVKNRYILTMDDKSNMLKEAGATFYNSIDAVPGLAKTVEEAIGLFEPFKERLRNMEDNYRGRNFCSSYADEEDETTLKEKSGGSRSPRWGIGWLFNELR